MSSLIFLDTETTGLSLHDDIWEVAAIRRTAGGSVSRLHLFIDHDTRKCGRLPEPFRTDHARRWPEEFTQLKDAARILAQWLVDRPHIVGAVPNFDTERIALLLRRFGYEPQWHHHLIDVEALALGYLHGIAATGRAYVTAPSLPWKSDDLSRACGVEPPIDARHTAMGDAEWAMALYDEITGRAS